MTEYTTAESVARSLGAKIEYRRHSTVASFKDAPSLHAFSTWLEARRYAIIHTLGGGLSVGFVAPSAAIVRHPSDGEAA